MFNAVGKWLLASQTGSVAKSPARHLSFRKIAQSYQRFWQQEPTSPPYAHVCQVGDPVLRARASPVDPNIIMTEDFQKVLVQLKEVMRNYGAVGISAPQLGLSWQIFAVELSRKQLEMFDKKTIITREMEIMPFKIFINPSFKITDHTILRFPEACESIRGYSAEVPRARGVSVSALNASGKLGTWEAKGWAARIVQHEMDHLQGKVFTDKMDSNTFSCTAWQAVNRRQGRIEIPFYPK